MSPFTPIGWTAAICLIALLACAIWNWKKAPTIHFVAAVALINMTLLVVRISEGAFASAAFHLVALVLGAVNLRMRHAS